MTAPLDFTASRQRLRPHDYDWDILGVGGRAHVTTEQRADLDALAIASWHWPVAPRQPYCPSCLDPHETGTCPELTRGLG